MFLKLRGVQAAGPQGRKKTFWVAGYEVGTSLWSPEGLGPGLALVCGLL